MRKKLAIQNKLKIYKPKKRKIPQNHLPKELQIVEEVDPNEKLPPPDPLQPASEVHIVPPPKIIPFDTVGELIR